MGDEKEFKLEDRGMVFLSGKVNQEAVSELAQKIIQINLEQKCDFIQMMISSPGGEVDAGFALIDLMQWSRLPVYTTGFGLVASMGLSILMAGSPGHRVLTPRATLMSHRFWGASVENYSGLVAKRKIEDLTHQRIMAHYVACSKLKDVKEVEAKLLRDVDTWLTPEEAVEFGLVDSIHRPAALA